MGRYSPYILDELSIGRIMNYGKQTGTKNKNPMINYDAYATTFSNSRKNLKWPELDAIIEDMRQCGYTSVLDVGCGNGRLIERLRIKSEE